jgi:hypothetical protein
LTRAKSAEASFDRPSTAVHELAQVRGRYYGGVD